MIKREWRGMTLRLDSGRIVTVGANASGERVHLSLADATITWFDCPDQNTIVARGVRADGGAVTYLWEAVAGHGLVGAELVRAQVGEVRDGN